MAEEERLLKVNAYLACAVEELRNLDSPWANRTLLMADIEDTRKSISARMTVLAASNGEPVDPWDYHGWTDDDGE